MPALAEELQQSHDDDGDSTIKRITGRYDANGIYIHGNEADRKTQTGPHLLRHVPRRRLRHRSASSRPKQARYIPETDPTSPAARRLAAPRRAAELPLPPDRDGRHPRS